MWKLLSAAALAAGLTIAPLPACAHGYTVGDLKIGHPWSPATAPGAPTAAGYLTITNLGTKPERLLGASAADFRSAGLHQSTMAGGIMRMLPLTRGLVIAPGQTVTLAPGGYHLMLTGPKHSFAAGDHIIGQLRFERAGLVEVDFHVQAAAPNGEHHHMEMKEPSR